MYTAGFACQCSGMVTLDVPFTVPLPNTNQIIVSSYIAVPTTATEGGIVYQNSAGQILFWPFAFIGYNPIAATMILTSATIGGVIHTTTATPLSWYGSYGA